MQAAQTVKTHFDLHEVVVLSGFTKHMLDYLAREEILVPQGVRGRGVRRRYSYTDLVLLRALHGICVSKGKIRHLKQALAAFRASTRSWSWQAVISTRRKPPPLSVAFAMGSWDSRSS